MGMNKDFREFLQSLNEHDVRYLVVGGYAVAFHGHPRYTRDLDIWIGSDPQNIRNLLSALKDFGFASLGLQEKENKRATGRAQDLADLERLGEA